MSGEDSKILEFNQYQKSDRAPFITFIIYAVLQCLTEKTDRCKNSFATKVKEHIPSGFSVSTISICMMYIEGKFV